jgi:hypothetical protein
LTYATQARFLTTAGRMSLSIILERVLTCLLFVLAVQIPVIFGFSNDSFRWVFGLGITVYFFTGATAISLLSYKQSKLDSAYLNQQLLFAVCMSLGIGMSFNIQGTGAFAIGVYSSSSAGRSTRLRLSSIGTWIRVIGVVVFIVGLHLYVSKSLDYSLALFAGIGFLVGNYLGDLVGILLSRCVPPLVHVWREVKSIARLLGGYSLGYLLLSVMFAGCYASLTRIDSSSFKGFGTSRQFVDYWYYSISVLTTVGSDANPVTPVAKVTVAVEVLLGIAWTVIVFAVVLAAVPRFNQARSVESSPPTPRQPASE